MKDALIYLVDSLLTIYLYLLILRFAMQLTRADFRNQLANFVVVVTNPVIMPLRRVLPPLGKVDTASVLAIIAIAAANIALKALIAGGRMLDPFSFAWLLLFTLVYSFLMFYLGAIVVFAILSWVVPAGYNPVMALVGTVVDPVLRPFRRIIPPIANFDLSVLWASLAIGVLLRLLPQLFGFTTTYAIVAKSNRSVRASANGEDSYSAKAHCARDATHRRLPHVRRTLENKAFDA